MTIKLNKVISDEAEHAVYDDVEREFVLVGGWVLDCDFGEVGCACEGFPAGLLVEYVFSLLRFG